MLTRSKVLQCPLISLRKLKKMPEPKHRLAIRPADRRDRTEPARPHIERLEHRQLLTAVSILAWEMTGQSAFGTQGLAATSVVAGTTNSTGLTRGTGVTTTSTAAANAWGGNGWSQTTSAAGVGAGESVYFGLTVAAGYSASLSSIGVNYRRSSTGPVNAYWDYQVNGGTWTEAGDFPGEFSSNASSGATAAAVSLSTLPPLQSLPAGSVVDLRLTPYGATSSGGTFYFYGPVAGNDLVVSGSVSTIASGPLTLSGPADYLQLDPDGTHLDIWNAVTNTGTPASQVLLSQISSVNYAGSTGDDGLVIDFSNGDPLPPSGLSFDGGTAGTNAMTLIGTNGDDTFDLTGSTVNLVAPFGTVPISYTDTTAIHLEGGAGNNTVTQVSQPNAVVSLDDPSSQDVVNVQAGTFTFPAAAAVFDSTSVNLDTLHIEAGATAVVASAASHALRTVLVLNTLEDAGTLDVKDNDLILHKADYANVLTALQSGRNLGGGYWNGAGITSSTAAASTTATTALALIQNADAAGHPLFGSAAPQGLFDGQQTVASDLIIKYTYYGDANLSGNVDGSDYSDIDNGFAAALTGWYNGDFNYDGVIDGSDYTLIDNAYNNQGPSLTPPLPPAVLPDVFPNWSAIGPAIALVPQTAGKLSSVSVVNFGTTVYTGPLDVTNTLNRIRADDGPDRSDDGIVYTNPQASGLPVDGTYYEFTVEPAAGTNMNFSSTIASPGPMRILLATGGDCYFTGDHYSTFTPVYIAGQDAPAIGGFTVSPASVATGSNVTLTAAGVTDTGSTISGVTFYRESDGTAGLQTAGDTKVGAATETGTTWSLANVSTNGLAAGSYTYYAVAADTAGFTSATAVTSLTITGGTTTAGAVLAWNVNGQNAFGKNALAASAVAAGARNSTGLTRASAVATAGTAASNAWGGSNWSTAASGASAVAANQFLTFGLTVQTGYTFSAASIDLNYRRSTSGPVDGYWQYELNTGSWVTIADVTNEFASAATAGTAMAELNLSGVTALQNLTAGTAVNFRLAPYAAATTGGTWYIYDLPGNDLSVNGSVTAG
jgi:hypothetical protein